MHHDYKCDGENVITGRYGTIGEVYYYNGKCWPLNTALFVSNFFDNYPKYIYYFLKCTLKVDGKDKSTVPGVDRNVLHALKVSYFSDKDYQIEIASVLSCIDAKIDLNAQLCAELEAMAKTLYDYWFVQFDFPDENGKPYRTSGGAMEWCQELGREVPKGWKAKRVSELTKVITGKEDANFSTADGEYKFFTCGQETLCCDTPAFTGKAVLIAGNGDFNVKHYTGSFNAYQRTYVLIPNEDKYYAAMFIAAKDTIQYLSALTIFAPIPRTSIGFSSCAMNTSGFFTTQRMPLESHPFLIKNVSCARNFIGIVLSSNLYFVLRYLSIMHPPSRYFAVMHILQWIHFFGST